MYLREIDPGKAGPRAHFGEISAQEVQLAVTNPRGFLKESGLDFNPDVPVEVTVHTVEGRAGAPSKGTLYRVTVILSDRVNVLSIVAIQ